MRQRFTLATVPQVPWAPPGLLPGRPPLRVNQVGYLPGRPMLATAVTEATQPVEFRIENDQGASWFGMSRPWLPRPETTSGLAVHVLDFTAADVRGSGVRLMMGAATSRPFTVADTVYQDLGCDALQVFRLLRSGEDVADVPPGYGRPAGHLGLPPNTGDVAVPAWTGPDAEQLYPGWRCEGTFDVSGGWYDAGDYGKYVTSGSVACWQLLTTLDLLADTGDESLRSSSDGFSDALREECRWQLEWLLRMQVPEGAPLAGMAFHRVHGNVWSPVPGLPHLDPTTRVLHRPSTPATLQLAATAARGARHFADTDPSFSCRLIDSARNAYLAAIRHPVLLPPDDGARFGGGPYADTDASDDLYWAACELWLATQNSSFEAAVLDSPWHRSEGPSDGEVFPLDGFDFDRVAAPARLDLAVHGSRLPDHGRVCASVVEAADRLLRLQQRQPWGQPYAPVEGWGWGSNGRLLNNLVVIAVAWRLTNSSAYRDAVITGIDYLFGRNALGQSYVTGYGADFSHHQRTRLFGHDLDPALPSPPPGALAGGPNSQPHPDFPYDDRLRDLPPQSCYLDEPTSEVTNDICIRWNAPLVYVAVLLDRYGVDRLESTDGLGTG